MKENILHVEDQRFVMVDNEFQFDMEYLIFSLDKLHHVDTKYYDTIEIFSSKRCIVVV